MMRDRRRPNSTGYLGLHPLPLLALAALASGLLIGCSEGKMTSTSGLPVIEVRIGESAVIHAEVARKQEDRDRGLGGRASLPPDRGMLFVFDAQGVYTFFMTDMRFPLDFIWVSADHRVVGLTANVLPEPGVPDAELSPHRPQAPCLYALAVNAGAAHRLGIKVGDPVIFTLP